MAVTLHFQSTGTVPGSGAPVQMIGPSLTIGRGQENDMVLPDPERVLSKRHCVIEDHGGNAQVIDLSTNGTFLNYSRNPLGPVPTPLNDGDVICLGTYELVVEIASARVVDPAADPAPPVADGPASHGQADNAPSVAALLDAPEPGGDFLDDLLGAPTPGGPRQVVRDEIGEDGLLPPLAEDESDLLAPAADPFEGQGASDPTHNPSVHDHIPAPNTGGGLIPDDWDDDLLGGPAAPAPEHPADADPAPPAAPIPDAFDAFLDEPGDDAPGEQAPAFDAPSPDPGPEPEPLPMHEPEPAPQEVPEPAPSVGGVAAGASPIAADTASRAFLAALGADGVEISDDELGGAMDRLGRLCRTMIEGVREVLMTRTSIKGEFRINQTMISAGGNNPLKFSVTPDQCIEALAKPKAKGYLDAPTAAQEALNDIRAHEMAMVSGMEAALKGVLSRLDPKVLEEKIETGGGLGSILKGKKARYWEVYEKMYAEISDQAENEFHDLFAREFARAYQDQLDKLK